MNERLDPPEPVEEKFDVYLTVLVRVHAPNEAGAIDEAKLCMREGDIVDSHAEPSCDCCPNEGEDC